VPTKSETKRRGRPRKPPVTINGADFEPLLDENQVAKILNVSAASLRAGRVTKTGAFGGLRWVKLGGFRGSPVRLEPSELREFIAKYRTGAPVEADEP
jgi:hypothetical protein